MVNLKAKPFYLDDSQIEWVQSTIARMTDDEKIGQLFCFNSLANATAAETYEELDSYGLKPCGFLLRGQPSRQLRQKIQDFQNHYEIPLFICGDLDRGASNMITDGTPNGHQMEIGATGDPELAYKAGLRTATECAAVGTNWDFGPVVDIDLNPYNPITNVRSFGSDADKVLTFARKIAQGMRDGGLTPCMKHWPGDGVDFRDQHFLASVNSLSVEEWWATFGKVYQGLIDDGMETLMSAHIHQPALARHYNPGIADQDLLPGSLNADLHNKLLRGEMGFNGLIITDATGMVGFNEVLPREQAIPLCVANGADIVLFSRNMKEDFEFLKKGVADGVVTMERVEEALQRILGLKAKMNLHIKKANGTLVPPEEALACFEDESRFALAEEIADKGITLVKDVKNFLPLDVNTQKELYIIPMGDVPGYHNPRGGYAKLFVEELEKRGFKCTVFDASNPKEPYATLPIAEFKKRYGAIIYFCNIETNSGDSAARISWPGGRTSIPQLISSVPMIMVSIDNPYHLIDCPRVPCYVNAYTSEDVVVKKLVEKLVGESSFKGVSPVDPFCGIFNARF